MRKLSIITSVVSIFIMSLLTTSPWAASQKIETASSPASKISASSQSSEREPATGKPSSAFQNQSETTPSTPFGPKTMPPGLKNRMESQTSSRMLPERRPFRAMPGWTGTANMEVIDFDGDNKLDVVILRGHQLLVINNKGDVILNLILPEPPEK